jgi:hypothetical protein
MKQVRSVFQSLRSTFGDTLLISNLCLKTSEPRSLSDLSATMVSLRIDYVLERVQMGLLFSRLSPDRIDSDLPTLCTHSMKSSPKGC